MAGRSWKLASVRLSGSSVQRISPSRSTQCGTGKVRRRSNGMLSPSFIGVRRCGPRFMLCDMSVHSQYINIFSFPWLTLTDDNDRLCTIREMRRLFEYIRQLVEKRYKGQSSEKIRELPWQSVSAFCFLRFIVPAILHPHLFGLCTGEIFLLSFYSITRTESSWNRFTRCSRPADVNADSEGHTKPC